MLRLQNSIRFARVNSLSVQEFVQAARAILGALSLPLVRAGTIQAQSAVGPPGQ